MVLRAFLKGLLQFSGHFPYTLVGFRIIPKSERTQSVCDFFIETIHESIPVFPSSLSGILLPRVLKRPLNKLVSYYSTMIYII